MIFLRNPPCERGPLCPHRRGMQLQLSVRVVEPMQSQWSVHVLEPTQLQLSVQAPVNALIRMFLNSDSSKVYCRILSRWPDGSEVDLCPSLPAPNLELFLTRV
jgi:hypothetical protein